MATESNSATAPLISVCMPVFNGSRFIEEAVHSVLAQSHRDFELQIFDDASSDDSWDRLQTIEDPRIVLHRNDRNLGPEANWNQAIASARGKYIKLFYQDDLLAPNCLARQVQALEDHPEAVLAFSSRKIIKSNGATVMVRSGPWADGKVRADELILRCIGAGANLIGEPSAVLFRADVARQVGGFDGSIPYVIDLDYWARLLAKGPGYYVNSALVSFRISSRQWSVAIGNEQSQQFISFIDKLADTPWLSVGPATRRRGEILARLNGFLRALVYRFFAMGN